MRVLLTSAGLETEEIKEYFVKMLGKDVSAVKALFIPTAAIDAVGIEAVSYTHLTLPTIPDV